MHNNNLLVLILYTSIYIGQKLKGFIKLFLNLFCQSLTHWDNCTSTRISMLNLTRYTDYHHSLIHSFWEIHWPASSCSPLSFRSTFLHPLYNPTNTFFVSPSSFHQNASLQFLALNFIYHIAVQIH